MRAGEAVGVSPTSAKAAVGLRVFWSGQESAQGASAKLKPVAHAQRSYRHRMPATREACRHGSAVLQKLLERGLAG